LRPLLDDLEILKDTAQIFLYILLAL